MNYQRPLVGQLRAWGLDETLKGVKCGIASGDGKETFTAYVDNPLTASKGATPLEALEAAVQKWQEKAQA